jgi:hypothetical protein
MPRYEVKFYLTVPEVLTRAEETEIAHSVYHRLRTDRGVPSITPEGRKVYIRREYSPQEERELVKAHASVDANAGRDWNVNGCSCTVCKAYRKHGAVLRVANDELT